MEADTRDIPQRYKSEDYETAAHLYQELLVTADQDSPEYVDLEHNLAASESFLTYKDELVGNASNLSGPLSSMLEDQPIGLLVAQQYPSHRVHASTSTAAASSKSSKKPKAAKLPAKIAAMPEDQRPAVDPERWLPKHLRSDYVDPRKTREEERRRKQKERMAVQGSGGGASNQSNASAGRSSGGGAGGQQKKKGKGKKK